MLAITVDVEDWYHIPSVTGSPFSRFRDVPEFFSRWTERYDYLTEPTGRVLSILQQHDIRATFFIVADVTERYPGLVRQIAAGGHEIACHGLFKHNLHRAMLASSIILVFTFFSLTTPYICPDTPYSKDRAARTGFRTSEVQAAATVARIYRGNLMMEARAARLYEYVVPEHDLNIREMKLDVAGKFEGMVMLGRILLVRETHVGGSGTLSTGEYTVLGQEYFDMIDRIPDSVLVYDNGEVIVYLVK